MEKDIYKTIEKAFHAEYTVERSRFIAEIVPVSSLNEAAEFFEKEKKKYWDAKHHVTAFSLKDGTLRCSDDGEPSGTAGMPVLEAIKSSGITECAAVVTRYFGGVLLGTGGLVRAYSTAAAMALKKAEPVTFSECDVFKISLPYSKYQSVLKYLSDNECLICDTDFGENVSLTFYIRCDLTDSFLNSFSDFCAGKIIPINIGRSCKIIKKG